MGESNYWQQIAKILEDREYDAKCPVCSGTWHNRVSIAYDTDENDEFKVERLYHCLNCGFEFTRWES